ncbi:MAG TPA: hypothetical protein VFZ53_23455 [Polyangiaceae bacterium]
MAVEEAPAPTVKDPEKGPHSPEGWRAQMDACRRRRDQYVSNQWQTNVAFRVQRPFSQASADDADHMSTDQIAVPADWSRTRSKGAALWSQLPRVSLEAMHQQFRTAVPIFEKIVNHFAPRSGILATLEECSADVVNASGVCAAMMKYEATFEDLQVPAVDVSHIPPQILQQQIAAGLVPMTAVKRAVSERYRSYRISPARLLWPLDFDGSDWQRARWLGYDGTMPWARAQSEFNLSDKDKDDVCTGAGTSITSKTLGGDITREVSAYDEQVRFSEIFYWAALCDPNEKRFEAIRRIVFVQGKDEPVIDEEYTGQKWNAQTGQFIGCTRLPIEVVALTYVSDRAIPPSDSEIGRPMVLEQIRSRSQMVQQRTRNLPVRTFDVNRVDPTIADLLMRGIWQGMLPTNGPGDRVFAQIAAAAFPREDFTFDQVSNRDLDDAWSMSPNQMGNFASGERSASEAQLVAGAYASVIGFQRQKIVGMFLGLVDTMMGLLQLNLDDYEAQPIVGQDGVQRLQQWDRSLIAGKYVAAIRQDASVLQDAGARQRQLMTFLNIAGKSGRINVDPIIAELAALTGLDPATVMLPPAQPKPEPMNVSYRLSGVPDLHDPIAMALLMKAGQAPGPQEIEAAKMLILDANAPPKQLMAPQPGPPQGAPGLPRPPGPIAALPPPPGAAPGLPSMPNRDWQAMERVTKRPDELGG